MYKKKKNGVFGSLLQVSFFTEHPIEFVVFTQVKYENRFLVRFTIPEEWSNKVARDKKRKRIARLNWKKKYIYRVCADKSIAEGIERLRNSTRPPASLSFQTISREGRGIGGQKTSSQFLWVPASWEVAASVPQCPLCLYCDPISALFLPRLQNKNSAFDTRFEHRHYDHSIQSKAELNLAVERFFCIVFPEKKNFIKESQWKIVT